MHHYIMFSILYLSQHHHHDHEAYLIIMNSTFPLNFLFQAMFSNLKPCAVIL